MAPPQRTSFCERLILRHHAAAEGAAPLHDVPARVRAMVGDWARLSGQCIGVFDLAQGRLVHAEGDNALLGPVMGNGSVERLAQRLHPDEAERVARLHLAFLDAVEASPDVAQAATCTLVVDHRLLANNGAYRRVIREKLPFAWEEDGRRVRATLHLCRDITGARPLADPVGHVLHAPDAVRAAFAAGLTSGGAWKPSKRQLELIALMSAGHSSKHIAEELGLSEHTVISYRRDLLRRSGQRNTAALMQHAARNGWLAD